MPLSDTVIRLLEPKYGYFPGPTTATYDAAEKFSDFLEGSGVTQVGVVGVAWSKQGYWYVAQSPLLAQAVAKKLLPANSAPAQVEGFRAYYGGKRAKVWICTKVDDAIAKAYEKRNPGCAEKRIVSAASRFGDTLLEMSIIQYPPGVSAEELSSYESVGDSDGVLYLCPCDSCLAVGKTYLNNG